MSNSANINDTNTIMNMIDNSNTNLFDKIKIHTWIRDKIRAIDQATGTSTKKNNTPHDSVCVQYVRSVVY